jgi:hypothetical protein
MTEGIEAEQRDRKVLPKGVARFDQADLPVSLPLLHAPFANDRIADVVISPHVDQPLHAVAAGEARDEAFAMFVDALGKVGRDADVERAVPAATEDVEVPGHAARA